MKFSTSLIALVSVLPFLAHGFALPEPSTSLDLATRETYIKTFDLLNLRADDEDEWQMVIYAGKSNGGQCGGNIPNNFSGTGGFCEGLKGVMGPLCADLSVGAEIGFDKCTFNFKKDGTNCGGGSIKKVTVDKGKDTNGVDLSDDVRFVSITCSK